MPRVIIPSGSGEILFVTDNSASLDFRNNSNLRTGSGVIGKWEVDPDDGGSIQFRIPKEKAGTSNDRIAFYISSSGRIGIGTKDPETAFDVRDIAEDVDPRDRTAKTKILKISKTSQEFDTPVTASIISASNHLQTPILKGNPTLETGLEISGFIQVTNITASGAITASGVITASQFEGSNIGSIYDNYIYLTPIDFDHLKDKVGITVAGEIENNGGYLADNSARGTYYAQKMIPKGYKATHVIVEGSSTSDNFKVHSSSYDVGTAVEVGSSTAVGTEKAITGVIGGSGTYVSIEWASRGNTDVYGGYIKLAKN